MKSYLNGEIMNTNIKRRNFIKQTSLGAAVSTFYITKQAQSANETINIGCIGTGGRCQRLMRDLAHIPNTKVTAVCDVWDHHLEMAKNRADKNAMTTKHYEDVLNKNDIDAVIIATPNHWHVPMVVDACEAGKDIYVEKPLTVKLGEGQLAIDAQNKHKRIVQVGMQQRSMPHIQKAREIIHSGKIGDVHKIHLTWNRNSPPSKNPHNIDPKTVDWQKFLGPVEDQPFDEVRFREWRWTWDFGGGILTDLMVHWLDVVHWICEVDHPQTANTIGDHIVTEGYWETPDTIQTLLHYPDKKLQVYFQGTFINARNRAMMEYMGRDATLYADRGRYEIHPENNTVEYSEMILGEGERGADFYSEPNGSLLHLQNWIDCIKNREKPVAPAEAGVSASDSAHLGNLAYREDKVARWNS